MHAIDLIYSALAKDDPDYPALPDVEVSEGVCCVLGRHCEQTLPRKHLLGPSWTQYDLLAAPYSDRVSVAAYVVLRYKWERMSSWFCDGKVFQRLDRIGVRNAVFGDVPDTPWVGYATTSYKKHGSMLAHVNFTRQRIWLWETELVDLSNNNQVQEIWQRLNQALRDGIPRPVLETLDASPWLIKRVGVVAWLAFERWARPLYMGRLYRFLCYLLPSQEELKLERQADEAQVVPVIEASRPSEPMPLRLFAD